MKNKLSPSLEREYTYCCLPGFASFYPFGATAVLGLTVQSVVVVITIACASVTAWKEYSNSTEIMTKRKKQTRKRRLAPVFYLVLFINRGYLLMALTVIYTQEI